MDSQITETLARELPEQLIARFVNHSKALYDAEFDRLDTGAGLPDSATHNEFLVDMARRARLQNGRRSLIFAGTQCGLQVELKKLRSNGTIIPLVHVGSLRVMAEPFDYWEQRPDAADYKVDLAASHFSRRQLEFDFGPEWAPRQDGNTMLVVLQHGMMAYQFSRTGTAMSMARVVVPDCSFQSWLWKAKILNDELAYMLDWIDMSHTRHVAGIQEDRVWPTIRPASQTIEVSRA
jgi:hypothetical protein